MVKAVGKIIFSAIMRMAALPFFFWYLLESALVGERRAFNMASDWVSMIPGIPGEWLRRAYLQWVTGLDLRDCCIRFLTTFSDPRLKIGNGVYIGRGCDIGYADVGANCLIGSGVHIVSGMKQHAFHDLSTPIREQSGEFSKVAIGEDCWIGNGAVVAADVGRKCVIGAGSVVVQPIPDFAVAAGNPARIIRFRDSTQLPVEDHKSAARDGN